MGKEYFIRPVVLVEAEELGLGLGLGKFNIRDDRHTTLIEVGATQGPVPAGAPARVSGSRYARAI